MVQAARSQAFKQCLAEREKSWRDGLEVVAMDGFTRVQDRHHRGTTEAVAVAVAVAVMDPFHVVRLAGDALDECRRRVQQDTRGHRGRKGDPLYAPRRTLHTGAGLLTDKQQQRLESLFAVDDHVEVEASWGIYHRMIAAYGESDRGRGKAAMTAVIEALGAGVPTALTELRRLGRTLKQRAADVLAYFDRPGTSKGPIEAIIIWSPQEAVADIADCTDIVRQRHVIRSLSTTQHPSDFVVLAAFSAFGENCLAASRTCIRRKSAAQRPVWPVGSR